MKFPVGQNVILPTWSCRLALFAKTAKLEYKINLTYKDCHLLLFDVSYPPEPTIKHAK